MTAVATNKGAQTRQAIIAAAVVRFGRDGYRATSVADVARDADVGGTVPYTYFANKQDLFLSALDEDATAVIDEGLSLVFREEARDDWRQGLMLTLVAAVDGHPLARRVLAGLEPDVTDHVVELPALIELRRAVGERLRAEQATGTVRTDIDPMLVGSGIVSIILSLLMTVLHLGDAAPIDRTDEVIAVFAAAIDPLTTR